MQHIIHRAARALLVVAVAASSAACATVTRGTSEEWTVQSEPAGAAVQTSTGFKCDATPCTFKMKRKEPFDVTVTKAGYKPATARISGEVGTGGTVGALGNVVLGGLIGIGVDATSGAMMDLKPNPLVVTLEAESVVAEAPASASAVAVDAPATETPVADTPAEPAA